MKLQKLWWGAKVVNKGITNKNNQQHWYIHRGYCKSSRRMYFLFCFLLKLYFRISYCFCLRWKCIVYVLPGCSYRAKTLSGNVSPYRVLPCDRKIESFCAWLIPRQGSREVSLLPNSSSMSTDIAVFASSKNYHPRYICREDPITCWRQLRDAKDDLV